MGFFSSIASLGLASPYDNVIVALAQGDAAFGSLIKGVIAAESSWNPEAANPADPSYGLMQVMLSTARGISPGITREQLMDPITNITIGVAFLRDCKRRFVIDSDAMAYYNSGCPTPKVAGIGGCPLRNEQSQYVNSRGSTSVQAYVDTVLTYQNYYMNRWVADSPGVAAPGEDVVPTDDPSLAVGGGIAVGAALLIGAAALLITKEG